MSSDRESPAPLPPLAAVHKMDSDGSLNAFAKRWNSEISALAGSLTSTVVLVSRESYESSEGCRAVLKHTVSTGLCENANAIIKSATYVSREVYRNEGLLGFFRGVTSPIVSTTLLRASGLVIYQRTKKAYVRAYRKAFDIDLVPSMKARGVLPDIHSIGCYASAGATAGILTTIVACPFELTKQGAQISSMLAEKGSGPTAKSYEGKGTFRLAQTIVKNRGVRGLFAGFQLQLTRDMIGSSIYFVAYETSKKVLTRSSHANDHLAVLASGAVCGVAAWPFIYAIDSAKAIYQRECLTRGKDEVVRLPKIGFFNPNRYQGFGVAMARSSLTNAVFWSVVELVKAQIGLLED